MEQSPKQQTIELIKNAKRILVLGHQHPDGDAIGSVLALTLALRKLGKDAKAICADPVPPTFQFLPAADQLGSTIEGGSSDFTITVDTTGVEVDKLGYKNHPDQRKLNIVIKTLKGKLEPDKVSFGSTGVSADLLIVLDTNDVERLGETYTTYSQLFYKTPIVNIDHHPGNGYFGKVNWVDLAATSTAEILVSLLEALGSLPKVGADGRPFDAAVGKSSSLLDADIATLLLAGITTDTGSFQNTNTTPKSFTVAAQLVAAGARQQEIVQHIYKTKPLSTLKLWGKILGNIREEQDARFIYSKAGASDFSAFGAAETETSGVVDELLKTVPNNDFALLLSEKKEGLYGSLRGVNPKVSVADIAALLNGGGHEMAAAFRIPNGSLAENEQEVIAKIRDFQQKMNSTPSSSETMQQLPEEQKESPNPLTAEASAKPASGASTTSAKSTPAQPSIPDLESLKAQQPSFETPNV